MVCNTRCRSAEHPTVGGPPRPGPAAGAVGPARGLWQIVAVARLRRVRAVAWPQRTRQHGGAQHHVRLRFPVAYRRVRHPVPSAELGEHRHLRLRAAGLRAEHAAVRGDVDRAGIGAGPADRADAAVRQSARGRHRARVMELVRNTPQLAADLLHLRRRAAKPAAAARRASCSVLVSS